MHVITFSVSIFFGFSPGIIVMASCLPFAFSRLPLWANISSFYHYTSKGKDKNKGQDGQRKVRQHFFCFLVLVDGIKLSYRATLRKTGYACLRAVVILVMPAASPSLELATLLLLSITFILRKGISRLLLIGCFLKSVGPSKTWRSQRHYRRHWNSNKTTALMENSLTRRRPKLWMRDVLV